MTLTYYTHTLCYRYAAQNEIFFDNLTKIESIIKTMISEEKTGTVGIGTGSASSTATTTSTAKESSGNVLIHVHTVGDVISITGEDRIRVLHGLTTGECQCIPIYICICI